MGQSGSNRAPGKMAVPSEATSEVVAVAPLDGPFDSRVKQCS